MPTFAEPSPRTEVRHVHQRRRELTSSSTRTSRSGTRDRRTSATSTASSSSTASSTTTTSRRRTDLHILEGQWAEKSDVALPYTIGHENAGWVHATGSAVKNVVEGDKVTVHPLVTCGLCRACRSGDDVHCENNAFPGIDTDGGYADYLKTSARSVVRIADTLEPSDVAALADAGLTAYHAAARAARRLTARDRCVVIGAGGLGHIGAQVLKAITPAELIVVDRNEDAVKLALSLGADHGVVATGAQVDEVLALTGGMGAEVVVDFVGEGGATGEGVRMLRRAGDYLVVGYGENISVPTIDIISTEINIIGNLVGSYNDLCELMVLAARGAVNLHTAKYALDDFQESMTSMRAADVGARSSFPEPQGDSVDLHHREVPRPARARRRLAGDLAFVHRGDAGRAGLPVVRLVAKPRRPERVRARRGVRGRRRRARQLGPLPRRATTAAAASGRDAADRELQAPRNGLVGARRAGGVPLAVMFGQVFELLVADRYC